VLVVSFARLQAPALSCSFICLYHGFDRTCTGHLAILCRTCVFGHACLRLTVPCGVPNIDMCLLPFPGARALPCRQPLLVVV
jgi:hypothetical protein